MEKNGKTTNLLEKPFHPEEELEDLIFRTEGILGDLFIVTRQAHSQTKRDIPDLVAVDREDSVVIIEVKDEEANDSVVPEVLRYAIWAETSPDSVKNLWVEAKNKPEDLTPDWDNMNVRIIIVAPSFKETIPRLINKINYDTELVEIKRFVLGENTFVFLNRVPTESGQPSRVSRGRGEYDEAWYNEYYNKDSVKIFFRIIDEVRRIVEQKGWKLAGKMNQGYFTFKYGFFGVFGVLFTSSKTVCLFFKVPQSVVDASRVAVPLFRYQVEWKQALYKTDTLDFDVHKLLPIFEAAYKNIVGE
jgi:hypothetical protein